MSTNQAPVPVIEASEVRVLEGPNLYFPRPAVKVSLTLTAYLHAPTDHLRQVCRAAGLGNAQPGAPGTEQRQRLLARLAERAVRAVSLASGTRRLGVRSRAGTERDTVTVAFVWRRRGPAKALGEAVAPVLRAWFDGDDVIEQQAERVRSAPTGPPARLVSPTVPVVSVTGTNGKTTTTRMLAHIAMTAGKRTAWSSTDGVVNHGELAQPGDYSGPSGARQVLGMPGVEIGILETARGGMLLKGMGVWHTDVSVVTNVSADHLGVHGIDTVDQLAEVKSIIARATVASGWTVLNGDDPRVWAMRAVSPARPWVFTTDPHSPTIRESLAAGGKAITLLDGQITVIDESAHDRLIAIEDVPMTLSGLSRHNISNALGAAAAALAVGIDRAAVIEGLRTFMPDQRLNPGRMNTYTVPAGHGGSCTVVVDMAHNEAGLDALLDVADGLRPVGAWVRLALGAAGDRTEEMLHTIGETAGRRANQVELVHKDDYLRGRPRDFVMSHLRSGLHAVGVSAGETHESEVETLSSLVEATHDGDVIAFMCHSDRAGVYDWLDGAGARTDDAATIKAKVVAARGEHVAEADIASLWALEDPQARIDAGALLASAYPGDARITYEVGGTFDSAGRPTEAIDHYRQALSLGLREPFRHRAVVQLASSLRNVGEHAEAAELLSDLAVQWPDSLGVAAFQALALHSAGRESEALQSVLSTLARVSSDADVDRYRQSLAAYAAALTE